MRQAGRGWSSTGACQDRRDLIEPEAQARYGWILGSRPSLALRAYHDYGRLNNVAGPGLPVASGVGYERVTNSELLDTISFTTTTYSARTYEANRDVLLMVEDLCNSSLISSYDYDIDGQDHGADNAGRRTKVAYGGSAFVYTQPPARMEWG